MNNTDSTSFQSILAGVKRLREQGGEAQEDFENSKPQETVRQASKPLRRNEVINSFNQQRLTNDGDDATTPTEVPMRISSIGKSVLVNTTQKANPLLNHLKNTNWRYVSSTGGNKIYYDYLIRNRSVLFLTLTYHKLYNEYIFRRIVPLQGSNDNILIFVVDDKNSEDTLTEITKMCMFKGFTLLVAFNFEQAAKYIEYLNR
ncbi:probable DNA repair protein RAD10 [Zygosaccharomyces bailii ISA1307]|nr:probable DNA repair protein RAD10 [Zygosaccharomyces bailii ISA1307]